jgi:hypothetical protein
MRIAGRSPQRNQARRTHHLMRDLENQPTRSMISERHAFQTVAFPDFV